ncbi:LysR family transcriptional regulator [Sphingomonas montanisoli]|uniref:LysR family transcriptional regulator n=1 Tax=Sphingomonas montanisoli TaxID=2606412 RepID=A0A5D9C2L6_9SPHN|nr:LysR family transcriptional regulator [Sphingomonas montanisoli]TZG25673.1 LysR family transcriptional regulator [Sphingomonas montanisoli]
MQRRAKLATSDDAQFTHNAELQAPVRGTRRLLARPDFYQLETFLRVAEARSFAAAARHLGISQPAVSQTIARLEELYGGDLFERRRGMPVMLTLLGRSILPKAKLLLFMVDTQMQRAATIAQSLAGTLTIGFSCCLGHGPFNAALLEFRQTRPDVELRFVEGLASDLYRQLNERVIDVMFVPLLPDLTSSPNEQERLWDERLFVALPLDHPLAVNDDVRWADISALTILLQSSEGDMSPYRLLGARMADRPFESTINCVSSATLLDMVKLGLGATIVCGSAAGARDDLAFRPIVDENALCSIQALWPKDDRNPLRHRLLATVRSHAT